MRPRRTYDYRHRVMLEETNLVGNVYFSNYFLKVTMRSDYYGQQGTEAQAGQGAAW